MAVDLALVSLITHFLVYSLPQAASGRRTFGISGGDPPQLVASTGEFASVTGGSTREARRPWAGACRWATTWHQLNASPAICSDFSITAEPH
jgi:hypothetical protein